LISTFPSDDRSKAEIAGAILTRQLSTLESIGHKDGAREAMEHVLEDLLSVYDTSWAPVQRARVLVTALGVSWRDGRSEGDGDASARFDVERVGQEALELLAREVGCRLARFVSRLLMRVAVQTCDADGMVSLVPQLKLGAHMWSALHAYRRSPAGAEMIHAVATHVEAAYNVLGGLLPGKAATEASPKGKPGSGTKATRSTNGAPKKGGSGVDVVSKIPKKATVGAGKSQPRKGGFVLFGRVLFVDAAWIVLRVVSLNRGEPTLCNGPIAKHTATTFDLQPVLGLIRRRSFLHDRASTDDGGIEMNVHLLGLLGLIVLKVKLLEILKRVCEHQTCIPAQGTRVRFHHIPPSSPPMQPIL
jgi:separase